MNRLSALVSACVIALASATPQMALSQSSVRVAMGTDVQSVSIPRGRSAAVDLPVDARDVIVSNPAVAEAMLHSPRRITLIGLAPGETDAVFLDVNGRPILNLSIRVDSGVHALQDTLSRLMPGANVRVEAVNESLILTGAASSPTESDRITQIARQFVSDPARVLNMMSVAGSDQVTVRARIVEVQRTAVKQLGVDLNAVLANASDSLALTSAATFAVNGNQLGGGGLTYTDNTGADQVTGALRAFERAGLVRILAEPNQTAVNGENAEFLAGGEFPVPVGRDSDGNVQIEFKPYGVRLAFRPIIMSENRISLQLSTEVSELTTSGAFTLGGTGPNALIIPALNVRRASTTVELPSGGSLMIAGLLREDTRQNIDQLPGVGDIPILGSLFRSRDYLMGETELVIIIEAFVVSPTSPGRMQTPADGLRIANDAQSILFGQLNQAYGRPGAPATPAGGWQGPVGYVIE
jgi:pilus assembly protein CpaC